MSIPSSVLSKEAGIDRLARLGVTANDLRESLHAGYSYAAGCTGHDPRSLPGILAWGKGIGHLRDVMKTRGWTADSTSNYETVVHPTNAHAIALASGTPETGRADGTPRTKTPKGPATSRVVKQNQQLSFAGADPAFGDALVDDKDRETWVLLHYYDREAEEIRCELSCPSEMTGKQVTGWRDRIMLDPMPFSADLEIDVDGDDAGEIDIDVSRRAD